MPLIQAIAGYRPRKLLYVDQGQQVPPPEVTPSVDDYTTPYRANISGAVSIDLAAIVTRTLYLTLVGNVTSFALTNPTDGAVYNIRMIQDATGGRTFSGMPSTFKSHQGTRPTYSTGANQWDFHSAQWGATEGKYAWAWHENCA
jgi:hypothetical protein